MGFKCRNHVNCGPKENRQASNLSIIAWTMGSKALELVYNILLVHSLSLEALGKQCTGPSIKKLK